MLRRVLLLGVPLLVVVALAAPATSVPVTTVVRTIQDRDGDNLLEWGPGEDYIVVDDRSDLPPGESFGDDFRPPRTGSILNFLQMTDFQLVDEESPGRVEFFDGTQRPPGPTPFAAAYRPQESLTTQIEEAMVRAARNTVSPITQEQLELTILTGDNADNQAYNETRWFIDILDGTTGPRPDNEVTFTIQDPTTGESHPVTLQVGPADKIDPNSGIEGICDTNPDSIYDGVRNSGDDAAFDLGFYEPDGNRDGDGYSPDREQNIEQTPGRDVTVRDFPRLFETANHRFEALGIDMPWYTAFGNHDALIQGNSTDAYFGPGSHYVTPVPPDTEIWNPQFQLIATGCVKPRTAEEREDLLAALKDGELTEEEIEELATIPVVPPDPRRCWLAKDEGGTGTPAPCSTGGWIEQHFITTGTPVGHGFAPAPCELPPQLAFDPENPPTPAEVVTAVRQLPATALCASYGRPPIADFFNDGYYSFTPRQGLRFIVLDTVTDDCGTLFCSEGSVDDAQFRWLGLQIEAAKAQGEYVMVFSHHTLRTTRWPTTDATEQPAHYGQRFDRDSPANPQNPTGERTLEELFCENPNVLAHITGHEHENYVRHHTCAQEETLPTAGAGDFWEISTAAHIDWPQQSRMIELIDNGDSATMSLALTMLDHAGPPNPGNAKPPRRAQGQSGDQVLKLASIGREIGYNDYQHGRGARGSRLDRNVIIILDRPWPYPSDDNGEDEGGPSLLP